MEPQSLPMKGKAWIGRRGGVALWSPAPSMLIIVVRGHGEAALVAPIVEHFDQLEGSALHLFGDLDALTSYDSALRTELTACFARDRKRIVSFPILTSSKIVAMGVTVANLALGGMVTTYTRREEFVSALDQSLFDLKVAGFSSNALLSFRTRFDSIMPPSGASGE
ncbi:MAG: hypothetical protein QM756_07535 [Polyangiaceae bacterium]